jgi:hypothetical protein
LPRIFLGFGLLVLPIAGGEQWPPGPEVREEPLSGGEAITSLDQLQGLSRADLEQLYALAPAAPLPVGFVRGRILVLSGYRHPRANKWFSELIWKGKHFQEDGTFVNQWLGFRAVRSEAVIGPSYFDGNPSLILEYPPRVPYFGRMRDEAREVAPGLYLCMVFERGTPPQFRGFIGLQLEPEEGGTGGRHR